VTDLDDRRRDQHNLMSLQESRRPMTVAMRTTTPTVVRRPASDLSVVARSRGPTVVYLPGQLLPRRQHVTGWNNVISQRGHAHALWNCRANRRSRRRERGPHGKTHATSLVQLTRAAWRHGSTTGGGRLVTSWCSWGARAGSSRADRLRGADRAGRLSAAYLLKQEYGRTCTDPPRLPSRL